MLAGGALELIAARGEVGELGGEFGEHRFGGAQLGIGFRDLGVEEMIDALLSPVVALPGGGTLVIEPTRALIAVDEPERMRWQPEDRPVVRDVRFRTLGCWPVTGAIASIASDLRSVVAETRAAQTSERQGRVADSEEGSSLEQKKREGYF